MLTQLAAHNSPLHPPFNQGYSSRQPGAGPPLATPYPPPFIDPKDPAAWDYGFSRVVTFLQSPPIGAGILSLTVFFLITFLPNFIIELANPLNLGIITTLSTLGLLALVVLILFIL